MKMEEKGKERVVKKKRKKRGKRRNAVLPAAASACSIARLRKAICPTRKRKEEGRLRKRKRKGKDLPVFLSDSLSMRFRRAVFLSYRDLGRGEKKRGRK